MKKTHRLSLPDSPRVWLRGCALAVTLNALKIAAAQNGGGLMIDPTLKRELHLALEPLSFSAQKEVLKFARNLVGGTLSVENARKKINALKQQRT